MDAYDMVIPEFPEHSLKELVQMPMVEWKNRIVNDFEKPVIKKYPVIGEIKRKLYDAGAIFAAMSGSGSAVYGLFKEIPQMKVQFPGSFIWISLPL